MDIPPVPVFLFYLKDINKHILSQTLNLPPNLTFLGELLDIIKNCQRLQSFDIISDANKTATIVLQSVIMVKDPF